jgi:hypothetical protein
VESDDPGKIYPMKVAGNGLGKILTAEELRLLFTEGLRAERKRLATDERSIPEKPERTYSHTYSLLCPWLQLP